MNGSEEGSFWPKLSGKGVFQNFFGPGGIPPFYYSLHLLLRHIFKMRSTYVIKACICWRGSTIILINIKINRLLLIYKNLNKKVTIATTFVIIRKNFIGSDIWCDILESRYINEYVLTTNSPRSAELSLKWMQVLGK